jgi:hypothetical protein
VEERQEAAINGRRSQNSERMRAHLYEREFLAKPVSRADCERERDAHESRTARRTRRCHGHGAAPPDECDMHLGCERPPPNRARDRVRGVAEGVAHAPDASVTAPDSRADCDTGGKERRPIDRGEVADRKEPSPLHRLTQSRSSRGWLISEPLTSTGDHCSRVCVPPSFSSLSQILPASRGARTRI